MKHLGSCLLLLGLGILLPGCGRPAGVIFPPLEHAIVWPAPPEAPRVKYVGQLLTEADLKPAVSLGQGLGEALFGKKTIQSMLTPFALCSDGRDRLFVVDSNAQLVHVFNLNTRAYSQWKPTQGFSQPVGIAFDPTGRRLFVADSVAACVYVFDDNGKPLSVINGVLKRPCGLAWDGVGKRLFVADAAAHQVVVFDPDAREITRLGSRGTQLGQFNYPTSVVVDHAGRLYVSDSLNFRVQQFDPDLKPIRQIGKKGDLPGYFGQPKGVAVDSQDHLYAVDANFESVQMFTADGKLLMDFGQEGRKPGEFWLPVGIFIDGRDRIWIADTYNRRVQVFDYLSEAKP